jgi:hypothetical protein
MLVLLAALIAGAALFPLTVLEIEDRRTGQVVFVGALEPGERLSLMYRHSVELSPVRDHFTVDREHRFVLTETVFSSSNTGLPTVLDEGERLTREPGAYRISGMRRVLPALELWVDRRAENTLSFAGREIALAELAGNTLLRLQVREVTLAGWAYRKTDSLGRNLSRRTDERPASVPP